MTKAIARLVDSDRNEALLTTRDAASYLGYHYVSIRRLVHQKLLRPATRAGRTLLFLRSELDRYRARRASIGARHADHLPNPPSRPPEFRMSATLARRVGGRWRIISRRSNFRWEDIPLLWRMQKGKEARRPFRICVQCSDGRELVMNCTSDARRLDDYWLIN